MRADAHHAVHAYAAAHVLAGPPAHDRDERVPRGEALELSPRLGRRSSVLGPRDDRCEHPVEVEEQARPLGLGGEPLEQRIRGHAQGYAGPAANPGVPDLDELWIPLVDEPIGGIVDRIVRDDPALAARVETPHRILAFRTFAYIRTGILLGQLLFDHDLPDWDGSESWVWTRCSAIPPTAPRSGARCARSRTRSPPTRSTPTTSPLAPDDGARDRFRAFAREHLGRTS